MKQFNSNIYNKSSWVIFKGSRATEKDHPVQYDMNNLTNTEMKSSDTVEEDKYTPIACSTPKYSFHESECEIIDKLRAWSKEYFEKNLVFDHEVSIPIQVPAPPIAAAGDEESKAAQPKRDFDILAQVVKTVRLDDVFSMVWFKDW